MDAYLDATLARDGCWRVPPKKNFLLEPGDFHLFEVISRHNANL